MNTFRGHPIISDQISTDGLGVVWRELERVLTAKVPGDIAEFGCYSGTTSLFIRRLLNETNQSAQRTFHVYDSFEGLPPKQTPDQSTVGAPFQAGELAVSKKQFLQNFQRANLQLPMIHKGWFNELHAKDVPEQIAFAFLDGDFYESILSSLRLVWPRLSPNATVLIDDYQRDALPGVAQAVHDFFQGRPPQSLRREHNIAIIRT